MRPGETIAAHVPALLRECAGEWRAYSADPVTAASDNPAEAKLAGIVATEMLAFAKRLEKRMEGELGLWHSTTTRTSKRRS